MLAEFKIRLCAGVPNLSKALRRRGGGSGVEDDDLGGEVYGVGRSGCCFIVWR